VETEIVPGLPGRLAAAPISWGVCEVPGWGLQLPPERVFAEMLELGVTATELGPLGWLPQDGAAARAVLDRYGLQLVGGFVPVVVHEPDLSRTREHARAAAAQLAEAGGEMFVAAVVQDAAWSSPVPLDADGWKRAGDHLRELAELASAQGVELVLHPHAGTLLETAADVELALEHTDVPWCLDTGHLLIGGTDPAELARQVPERIAHTHLKDVDLTWARRVQEGRLSYTDAVRQGMYRPLGQGDVDVKAIVDHLRGHGYHGWWTLEQDTILTEEPTGEGPLADVRASVDFLRGLLPA
jgi:inosose dehydratase